MLESFGFTATVFLPTAFIGNGKPGLVGKKHLDWSQVRELCEHRIGIGSHTVNHRQLWKAEANALLSELRLSKETIEEKTGVIAETFCYPYWFPEQDKRFVMRIKDLLNEYGYAYATGTRVGTVHLPDERMILKRIPVNSGDDLRFLWGKLSGNYDWVQRVQRAYKKIKAGKPSTGRP